MDFFKKLFGGSRAPMVGGLDVGSSMIKVAQVRKTSSGAQLVAFGACPTPPMTIRDGAVVDARMLGDAIRQLLADSSVAANTKIVSAVTGQQVVIRPISMTKMTEKELIQAIRFEAERYLPYSVTEAQITGIKLQDTDEKSMDVLLIAAPNEMVNNAKEVVKMAEVQPEAIDLEPFALLRALQLTASPEKMQQCIALVNLGASSSSINIFKGGVLRHNRTITIAGNSFTKAIGQSLNLSFEEAEKIKKEKGVIRVEKDATPVPPTTMRIFNVILPVLTELVTEVQRSFDYYRSRYRGESVDLVVLSGGTARFKNIEAYLSNELSIQCEVANPFRNLSVQKISGMTPDDLEELAPSAMAVIGLALREV